MSQVATLPQGTVEKSIRITTNSIRERLKQFEDKPLNSLAEYIWNGFDADANNIWIDYSFEIETNSGATLGHPSLTIRDDGYGWDMSNQDKVENFLDSDKKMRSRSDKSLPHGKKGVGRFTFFGFAKSVEWTSVFEGTLYDLRLEREDMVNYRLKAREPEEASGPSGTTVAFDIDNTTLNKAFFEVVMPSDFEKRFGWFLLLYPNKRIYLNGKMLTLEHIIGEEKIVPLDIEGKKYTARLVRWNESLLNKENSKLYFTDGKNHEIIKFPSGMNNKRDVFYHSAYIAVPELEGYSISLSDSMDIADDSKQIAFLDSEQNKLLRTLRALVKDELEKMRHPHVKAKSEDFINEWRKKKLIPDATQYGIDPDLYDKFIKKTFVIVPSLYLGVDDEHLKMILNLFATLLGSDRKDLTLKLLGQFHEMTDSEKDDLARLLKKTTVSRMVSTIKEVDQRLEVIDALDRLVHDPDIFKNTLEVRDLQQIINNEFWVFGEEYRLVVDTEGSIRNAVKKFAKDILGIEDYSPEADSKKEMDLLISKKEEYSGKIKNIVVELKRPSVKLTEKELSQIKNYRKQLLKDPACTDENIEWVFILIGRDYDADIKRAIESMKSNGEQSKGLVEYVESERTKIYVRKWSGTIGDLRSKHRYLSSRLASEQKGDRSVDPQHITTGLVEARHG